MVTVSHSTNPSSIGWTVLFHQSVMLVDKKSIKPPQCFGMVIVIHSTKPPKNPLTASGIVLVKNS